MNYLALDFLNAAIYGGGMALLVALEQRRDDVGKHQLSHGTNLNDKLSIEPRSITLYMTAYTDVYTF